MPTPPPAPRHSPTPRAAAAIPEWRRLRLRPPRPTAALPGVTVVPTALSVPEGGSRNYTVVLNTRPSGNVTVAVGSSGDGDLSASANALTFTTANWGTEQTVTVSAAQDSDALAGEATFTHTPSGGGYAGVAAASVVATEIDDETPGVTVAPTVLSVPEGGGRAYTVVLDAPADRRG